MVVVRQIAVEWLSAKARGILTQFILFDYYPLTLKQ